MIHQQIYIIFFKILNQLNYYEIFKMFFRQDCCKHSLCACINNQKQSNKFLPLQIIMSELYTVQSIIDKRLDKRGIVQYKVKWKGYSENDCTWEPLKNLQYVKDLVRAYDKQNKSAQSNQTTNKQVENQDNFNQDDIYYEENDEQPQEYHEDQKDGQNYEPQENFMNDFEETTEANDHIHKEKQKESHKNTQDFDNQNEQYYRGNDIFDNEELQIKQSAPRKMQKTQAKKTKSSQNQKKKGKEPKTSKNIQKQQIPNQSQKSYLQSVQQRTRFVVKSAPNKISPSASQLLSKSGELKVLQISKSNQANQWIYLTQLGPICCYRSREIMRTLYPDALIKFYESRIEFAKIPKLSK